MARSQQRILPVRKLNISFGNASAIFNLSSLFCLGRVREMQTTTEIRLSSPITASHDGSFQRLDEVRRRVARKQSRIIFLRRQLRVSRAMLARAKDQIEELEKIIADAKLSGVLQLPINPPDNNRHAQKVFVTRAVSIRGTDGKYTPEYNSWHAMRNRCLNPQSEAFSRYGGRGIRICDRWLDSFKNFLDDMGVRPSRNHSLDRINNDGNYEPANCRWADKVTQSRNSIRAKMLTAFGETRCINDWAKHRKLSRATIRNRLKSGFTAEEALSTNR